VLKKAEKEERVLTGNTLVRDLQQDGMTNTEAVNTVINM
jgi:hypothetical protein